MKAYIILHKIQPNEFSKLTQFVNRCICFFSRSPYWHTSLVLGKVRYESGHPRGVSKSLRIPPNNEYYDFYSFEVTEAEMQKMVNKAEKYLKDNIRYNHHKLIALAFFHPFMKLVGKFGWKPKWMPFSHDYFGHVCSVNNREITMEVRNLLPDIPVEYTAPGDFTLSPILKYEPK